MLRSFVAVVLLGLTVSTPVSAQYRPPYEPYDPRPHGTGEKPYTHRPSYHIQFRQPEWREQVFHSRQEMDEIVHAKKSNGWEVRINPAGYDQYRIAYRLRNWGGSRFMPTMADARQWAQYLEATEGVQTRIVPYGPRDRRWP